MKKLQNWAGFTFIFCTAFLTVVSVLGIWKVLNEDVVGKSTQTISLLAVVTVIIIIAGRFIDKRAEIASRDQVGAEISRTVEVNPAFTSIRHATLGILIAAVTLLTLLGVLSIWDVLSGETLTKSLSSMALVAFASLVIVITCLERENRLMLHRKISGAAIFGALIALWILISLFRFLW